jgi:hypothetical protein
VTAPATRTSARLCGWPSPPRSAVGLDRFCSEKAKAAAFFKSARPKLNSACPRLPADTLRSAQLSASSTALTPAAVAAARARRTQRPLPLSVHKLHRFAGTLNQKPHRWVCIFGPVDTRSDMAPSQLCRNCSRRAVMGGCGPQLLSVSLVALRPCRCRLHGARSGSRQHWTNWNSPALGAGSLARGQGGGGGTAAHGAECP